MKLVLIVSMATALKSDANIGRMVPPLDLGQVPPRKIDASNVSTLLVPDSNDHAHWSMVHDDEPRPVHAVPFGWKPKYVPGADIATFVNAKGVKRPPSEESKRFYTSLLQKCLSDQASWRRVSDETSVSTMAVPDSHDHAFWSMVHDDESDYDESLPKPDAAVRFGWKPEYVPGAPIATFVTAKGVKIPPSEESKRFYIQKCLSKDSAWRPRR